MPRSFAERLEERTSLSRGSFGKGSLGRYSNNGGGTGTLNDAISIGSAATRHWVNSVSDIYGPDEIEELLDDLNRLELAGAAYSQSEDEVETYDYQGLNRGLPSDSTMDAGMLGKEGDSGHVKVAISTEPAIQVEQSEVSGKDTEMQVIGGDGAIAAGGVEENGGEYSMPIQTSRGSPTFSVKSWDSHTHYQEFKEPEDDDPDNFFPSRPMQSIVCYCDISTFKTPRTLLRVLLVVTSIACLSTVLTAGTAKMGLFALPQFPKLRIMVFVTVFTVVFTVFIIFLNISHLHALLPFEYGKMQTVVYLLVTIAYAVASTLVFQAHSEYNSMPKSKWNAWTANQLLITSLLGYTCMVETFLCIFNCGRPMPPPPSASKSTDIHQPYDKMVQESSTHFTLHETTSRAVTTESIQRQLPPPSAPPAPAEQQRSGGETRKRQYLVNENYENIGGSGNAPPVKGGQISVPHYNANAPSSNAKHNQSSKISKSTSNPAQTLPSDSVNPQKQYRSNVEHANRNTASGHKNFDESKVQNQHHKVSNSSSRSQQYQSWSSKNFDPLTKEDESLEMKNQSKHRSNARHETQVDNSRYESFSANVTSSNPQSSSLNPAGKEEPEGTAYWSATTGKTDLIVHDSSRSKSDKSTRKHTDSNVRQSYHSSHHTKKSNPDEISNQQHHSQHKHKDHHHSSRSKSAGGSKHYSDYNSSSNNKYPSSFENNYNNTYSANISDSKYNNAGVNNNVTGDNCNSDHRHRSRTTTHATVEPQKRTSKRISSAMVPQHYYLSNTPDIPPPLPSCPPPPLDTPPPTKSNLPNHQSHFSYNVYNPNPSNFSSSYKSSTSHNYQSNHPSSLDNRNKINNSVHGDNSTVSISRSGGQNKKLKDNEKPVSPPLSTNDLSDLKNLDAGNGKTPKSDQGSSVPTGLAPLTSNIESSENKLSKISTTAVISSESTSSSTVTNLPLESSIKTSIDAKYAPSKSTGAIPKKKKVQESYAIPTSSTVVPASKPSTTSTKSVTSSTNQNHLDEIVSFPLDDSISSSNVDLNSSLRNRTNLPHNLMKDPKNPTSSVLPSYDGGSSSKQTTKNSQRHYVQ